MGRKILSIFMAIAVAAALSACQAEDTGHNIELVDESIGETATETTAPEKSAEVLLPDGWTMDELRNILIINGETLTLPTTLNKIMELDENFSYEAEYVDEKSPLYSGEKGFYVDVLYAGESMFLAAFASDENDIKKFLDDNIYNVSFSSKACNNANVAINTSCELNFTSSYEDIVAIFGEPNTYNIQDAIKTYEFYDNSYKYLIEFSINDNNLISRIRVTAININDSVE